MLHSGTYRNSGRQMVNQSNLIVRCVECQVSMA